MALWPNVTPLLENRGLKSHHGLGTSGYGLRLTCGQACPGPCPSP